VIYFIQTDLDVFVHKTIPKKNEFALYKQKIFLIRVNTKEDAFLGLKIDFFFLLRQFSSFRV